MASDNMKHYVLKQMIGRIDYDGLMDSDIEPVVRIFRKKLLPEGFVLEETLQQQTFSFKVGDGDVQNDEKSPFVNGKIYVFAYEDVVQLSVCKNYVSVEFRDNHFEGNVENDLLYKGSEYYLNLLNEIYATLESIYKDVGIPVVQRIGVRKVNGLMFQTTKGIEQYLNTDLFNLKRQINSMKYSEDNIDYSQNLLRAYDDESITVIAAAVQMGKKLLPDKSAQTVWRAFWDIDSHLDKKELVDVEIKSVEKVLKHLNENTQKAFRNAVSDSFMKLLQEASKEDIRKDKYILEGVNSYDTNSKK